MREREREENGFQRRRSDDHFKRSTKFKRPGISNLDQHLEKKKKKKTGNRQWRKRPHISESKKVPKETEKKGGTNGMVMVMRLENLG